MTLTVNITLTEPHCDMNNIHKLKQKIYSPAVRILLVAVVLIMPVAGITVFPADVSAAQWLGDSWGYRREITITGNGSDLTDIQYQLTGIDTQALYTTGKLQFNCEDVRFTNANGALLYYWIEDDDTACGEDTSTDFWIRLPRAETEGTTVYMYYGNPAAEPYSSGSNTFHFFDDLNSYNAPWYDLNWPSRVSFKVNHSKVESSSLTDFPVYFDLSLLGDDFWNNVDPQGDDIVITAANGTTKLSRELVSLNTGTQTGQLWFKAPQLSGTEDTLYYLYFGYNSAAETNDTGTWTNYASVHHLESDPSGSAPQFTDSSAAGLNGTSGGTMNSGDLVSGIIGNSIEFDGVNDYISIGTNALHAYTNNFSVSAWVNLNTLSTGAQHVFGTYGGRWVIQETDGLFQSNSFTSGNNIISSTSSTGWVHLAMSKRSSGTGSELFINGRSVSSSSATANISNVTNTSTQIGSDSFSYPARSTDGRIDEVRFHTTPRTAGWFATEYNNQSSPEDFLTIYSVQSSNASGTSMDNFQLSGSPQFSNGTVSLSDASTVEGIQSDAQFGINSKAIFRASQSTTALQTGRLGFSNSAFPTGFTSDDAAMILLNSGTNWHGENSNEGSATTAAGSIAETTALSEFEVGWRTGGVDFRINNISNGAITTNVPNESSYVRFESDNTADTITLDWIAVAGYNADPPDSQVVGSEELGSGPVLYLPLDETSGQELVNRGSGGSALNGYLGNTAAASTADPRRISDCISGNCLSLDGTTDMFQVNDHNLLDFGTGDFTLSLWMKPGDQAGGNTNYSAVFIKASNPSPPYEGMTAFFDTPIATPAGRTTFRVSNASELTSNASGMDNNTWRHFTYIRSSNQLQIYINGVLDSTLNISSLNITNTAPLRFGSNHTSTTTQNFYGLMDEIKVWPRALSLSEIREQYNENASVLGSSANSTLDGLAGWWKMDDANWNGTAGEVRDSSGLNLNGTTVNGTGLTSGITHRAASFDATNDRIDLPASSALDLQRLSITAWIYPNALDQNGNIFTKTTNGSDNTQYLCFLQGTPYNTPRLIWRTVNGATSYDLHVDISSTPITASSWHHIACTYDGSFKRIYVNGELEAEVAFSTPINTNAAGISRIGSLGGGFVFNGRIDDVRVYNRGLSEEELYEVYTYQPGPLAHWKFDEQSGTTVFDDTLNTLNGSLVNMDDSKRIQGRSGNALDFDGTVDYVSFPSDSILPAGNQSRSLSFWARPRTLASGDRYFSMGNWAVGNSFDVVSNVSNRISVVGHTNNYISTASVPLSTWTHVGIVLNGTNLRFYLNGKLDSSHTVSLNTVAAGEFRIGGSLPSRGATDYDGYIDDMRIYGYALTQTELVALWQHEAGIHAADDSADLYAYWKFDESTWTGISSEVHDSSGNSNHLTAFNGVTTTGDAVFGRAGSFNGSSHYLSGASFNVTGDYSVTGWFKTSMAADGDVIALTSGGNHGILIEKSSSVASPPHSLRFLHRKPVGISGGQNLQSNRAVNDSTWHFFCCRPVKYLTDGVIH
ncbi:MAG: hypothetical protein TR69_WS6001001287 [candidate division WS6 bacterium OLB20]|uniref:LamG-like jellyroll fold domain-containing protein n=1 Tax=candidate division WS6 bacterium OLB20 TaxID=1617426 RepID=A0A136LWG2_9BACT|nr:MAG: hypothetical protein TR69_WS6001001287 [candidate division WS6 bacterium OLB20]